MELMFNGASSFISDLSKWRVENVVGMSYLFNNARLFNSDLSTWNVLKLGVGWNDLYDSAGFTPIGLAFTGADQFDGILCNDAWATSPLVGASKTDSGLPTIAGGRFICCKPGQYRLIDNGVESCQDCSAGSINTNNNAELACEKCGRDTFAATDAQARCFDCDSDMFSSTGQTRCTLCPAGWSMVRGELNTTCEVCAAGKFQKDPGKGEFFNFF
jgi:hypothetical protein